MTEIPFKPPVWVARPPALQTMLADLMTQPRVAVDTESNSLFAYREQVCLIQFSTPLTDYLVDPLAIQDLAPLGELFTHRGIEKIFHAAEYDLICLKRDFDFQFNTIFDTMQAARILGRTDIGLAGMLNATFGIELEKRYQRANWGERPLTPAMLAYARLDTHYLIDLRDLLETELIEKDLLHLAHEDFEHLTRVQANHNGGQPASCWRMVGKHDLTHRQCAILQALIDMREQLAQKANQPPFKILANQALIDIALASPQNYQELSQAEILNPRLLSRYSAAILHAVQRGMVNPAPPKPVSNRPEDAVLERIDALKNWRKLTARELEVESDIVLPRDLLESIAFRNPVNAQELRILMQDFPWRYQRFGDQILTIIQPKHKKTNENSL